MQGWTTLPTTSFGIFAACNLKWLETNTPMAPEADLNTGTYENIRARLRKQHCSIVVVKHLALACHAITISVTSMFEETSRSDCWSIYALLVTS
jgi:hypothetical protein